MRPQFGRRKFPPNFSRCPYQDAGFFPPDRFRTGFVASARHRQHTLRWTLLQRWLIPLKKLFYLLAPLFCWRVVSIGSGSSALLIPILSIAATIGRQSRLAPRLRRNRVRSNSLRTSDKSLRGSRKDRSRDRSERFIFGLALILTVAAVQTVGAAIVPGPSEIAGVVPRY